jgi:DeoR family fructose operon transcriptional repressor
MVPAEGKVIVANSGTQGSSGLLPAVRQKQVLRFIEEHGSVQVRDLIEHFGVSEATVRRDLDDLAARDLVQRTHGGAVARAPSTSFEALYEEKRGEFAAEKRRIAEAAVKVIRDGETVILDSGSTTLEVARNLAGHRGLTVITYDLFIATAVSFDPSTTVVVPGGSRREGFNTLIGPLTEAFFRGVRVDRTILSADAVDVAFGVSNATFAECAIKQLLIEAGRQVLLVADASKFGKQALAKVCSVGSLDLIVTDASLGEPDRRALEQAHVELQLT